MSLKFQPTCRMRSCVQYVEAESAYRVGKLASMMTRITGKRTLAVLVCVFLIVLWDGSVFSHL